MSNKAILWGFNFNPNYKLTQPIKLEEYRSQKQQKQWEKDGWETAVYAKGDEPTGFSMRIEAKLKSSQLAEASQ